MTSPATSAPRMGESPTDAVRVAARITTSNEMARNSSDFFDRAAWANRAGSRNRPATRMARITRVPLSATAPRLPALAAAPPAAPIRNSIGTSARSSNNSIASAARPTGLWVPLIGSTSAVELIASARLSHNALCVGQSTATRKPPISAAVPSISAAPIPNTIRRIANSRLKLSSRPIPNSSRTIPSSANGVIPSGSVIVTASSHG